MRAEEGSEDSFFAQPSPTGWGISEMMKIYFQRLEQLETWSFHKGGGVAGRKEGNDERSVIIKRKIQWIDARAVNPYNQLRNLA